MVLQPDRWELHPEDFRARMNWERERQRILDAQAKAIQEKLPEPTEKIPPIPELRHPNYHLRHKIRAVLPETDKPRETDNGETDNTTETDKPCIQCGKRFTPSRADARFCSPGCRLRFHREAVAASSSPDVPIDS